MKGYNKEDYDRLYERLEEEFDVEDLTEEKLKEFLGAGKGRAELAKEISKSHEISRKIEEAPSKQNLKEIQQQIKAIPVKRQELRDELKQRRIELTPVEKFARSSRMKLSRFRVGRLEERKDGSRWVTIRSNKKGSRGRIITAKKLR